MNEENKTIIKDLLIKLEILRNGLIDERKKNKNYLDKIKELENILQRKDNEIVELNKKKFDLEANLTFEKSKRTQNKQNKKKNIDDNQVNQWEEIINEQGFRLRNLNTQLIDERESFDQQKIQFQTLITLQNQKLDDLKKKYEIVNQENIDLTQKQKDIKVMLDKFDEEKKEYLEKFQRYQNDKIEVQNKNVELQNQLDVVRKEKYQKEKDIEELNKKIDEMAIKLNDMKTLLLNKQLSPKAFKVEMIKPKKILDITFRENTMMENYEMVLKGKSKKEMEEHINILDITEFKINEKDKNIVEIQYFVSKL